jgi:NAD(P)-dependent dehydrogenase (short-subunit alcohol dehydrogenase family)
MCGYVLARRLAGTGVTVNALHPGITATTIIDDIAPRWFLPFIGIVKPLLLTPEKGARTTTYLATAPEVAAITGKYFIKQRERQSPPVSYDTDVQQQIWQISAQLVGLTPRSTDVAAHTNI